MGYLDIEHLYFQYSSKRMILKDINLSINQGEWIAILGHNGSGKSTLAKLIVGLLQPKEGRITVDGVDLLPENVYDIRKKIGIVFQNPDNQFVGVTVRDDIAFGMENLQVSKDDMLKKIDFYATKVGMQNFLDKEPSQLSGGQKQRIAIAGILAMQTDIIIFDEATSMLDPGSRAELMEYIKELHQEGLTIIMITHDIEEALYADKLVILKSGEIYQQGDIPTLLKHPEWFKEAYLELPTAIQIYYDLKQAGHDNQELEEYLWAFSSSK
ncbi:MAG: energy-coupling factor transporter ATPase [Tenericutes bacterium HGW-Tenericutes-1]|nr:MAG: energy-coupling factor transporter ATPase [Tenericutes bacterium HGW-Tenericutes-1]